MVKGSGNFEVTVEENDRKRSRGVRQHPGDHLPQRTRKPCLGVWRRECVGCHCCPEQGEGRNGEGWMAWSRASNADFHVQELT